MIIERTVLSNAQLHEGNRGVLRFFDLERHPRAPGVKGAPLWSPLPTTTRGASGDTKIRVALVHLRPPQTIAHGVLSEGPAKAGLGIASVGRYEAPKLLTGTPTREKKLTTLAQAADGTKMGPLLSAADSHADHLVGLATCNNAEKVGDMIVANEVEYKMFQATGWKFTSSDGVSPVVLTCGEGRAHVVHQRNDFCHSRMTQSVIVEKPCGVKEIYVKGSFETVAAFCKQETLPADYARVAQRHALAGCYVLALAKRVLGTQVRRIVFCYVRTNARADCEADAALRRIETARSPKSPQLQ